MCTLMEAEGESAVNTKGRGQATHQLMRGPTFLKGINLSETVSICLILTFPAAKGATFMNLNYQLAILYCLSSVFVSVLSVSGCSVVLSAFVSLHRQLLQQL